MLPSLFRNSTVPALAEVLEFTQARHEVLAGNIANLDTPGYQVRDLSPEVFQQRLKEAIKIQRGERQPVSLGLAADPDDELRQVSDKMETILFHDQSNVGLEQQVHHLSNNQFTHNMAIALLRSQFQVLTAAISERV